MCLIDFERSYCNTKHLFIFEVYSERVLHELRVIDSNRQGLAGQLRGSESSLAHVVVALSLD